METQYCINCKHSFCCDEDRLDLLQCRLTQKKLRTGAVTMKFCDHIRKKDVCENYEYEEKTGHTTTIVVFVSFAAFCAALYLAI